jgi:uncharacterized protein YceH (UPF0502 family)
MPLSDPALRVLGSLLEKERTTPDAYPLTSQALLAACNQKTARDPVLSLHLREVEEAMRELRDRGLAATVRGSGDRVPKHRQRLVEALSLTPREAAVLALLILRGPQTAGELRTRGERYGSLPDVAAVEATLARLAARSPTLVSDRGRGPGQSQNRWAHTLGRDEEAQRPRARPARDEAGEVGAGEPSSGGTSAGGAATGAAPAGEGTPTVRDLLRRIEALEARVAALEAERD